MLIVTLRVVLGRRWCVTYSAGGVACHALVGKNELDDFSARILDLASLSEATTLEELEEGGRRIAG